MTGITLGAILLEEDRSPSVFFFFYGGKMATGNLWKVESNIYSIQVSEINKKEKKEIKQIFKDWKETASGFHRDGSQLLIFSKELLEDENIYKFVKQLPFPLVEEKKNGELKTVKTRFSDTKTRKPLTSSKNHGKIKGSRSCSRCGQKGHNSRTCKNEQS